MTAEHIASELWAPATYDAGAAELIAAPRLTYWQDMRQRLWRNKLAMTGLVFIVLLSLAAAFGPLVYRHNYSDVYKRQHRYRSGCQADLGDPGQWCRSA